MSCLYFLFNTFTKLTNNCKNKNYGTKRKLQTKQYKKITDSHSLKTNHIKINKSDIKGNERKIPKLSSNSRKSSSLNSLALQNTKITRKITRKYQKQSISLQPSVKTKISASLSTIQGGKKYIYLKNTKTDNSNFKKRVKKLKPNSIRNKLHNGSMELVNYIYFLKNGKLVENKKLDKSEFKNIRKRKTVTFRSDHGDVLENSRKIKNGKALDKITILKDVFNNQEQKRPNKRDDDYAHNQNKTGRNIPSYPIILWPGYSTTVSKLNRFQLEERKKFFSNLTCLLSSVSVQEISQKKIFIPNRSKSFERICGKFNNSSNRTFLLRKFVRIYRIDNRNQFQKPSHCIKIYCIRKNVIRILHLHFCNPELLINWLQSLGNKIFLSKTRLKLKCDTGFEIYRNKFYQNNKTKKLQRVKIKEKLNKLACQNLFEISIPLLKLINIFLKMKQLESKQFKKTPISDLNKQLSPTNRPQIQYNYDPILLNNFAIQLYKNMQYVYNCHTSSMILTKFNNKNKLKTTHNQNTPYKRQEKIYRSINDSYSEELSISHKMLGIIDKMVLNENSYNIGDGLQYVIPTRRTCKTLQRTQSEVYTPKSLSKLTNKNSLHFLNERRINLHEFNVNRFVKKSANNNDSTTKNSETKNGSSSNYNQSLPNSKEKTNTKSFNPKTFPNKETNRTSEEFHIEKEYIDSISNRIVELTKSRSKILKTKANKPSESIRKIKVNDKRHTTSQETDNNGISSFSGYTLGTSHGLLTTRLKSYYLEEEYIKSISNRIQQLTKTSTEISEVSKNIVSKTLEEYNLKEAKTLSAYKIANLKKGEILKTNLRKHQTNDRRKKFFDRKMYVSKKSENCLLNEKVDSKSQKQFLTTEKLSVINVKNALIKRNKRKPKNQKELKCLFLKERICHTIDRPPKLLMSQDRHIVSLQSEKTIQNYYKNNFNKLVNEISKNNLELKESIRVKLVPTLEENNSNTFLAFSKLLQNYLSKHDIQKIIFENYSNLKDFNYKLQITTNDKIMGTLLRNYETSKKSVNPIVPWCNQKVIVEFLNCIINSNENFIEEMSDADSNLNIITDADQTVDPVNSENNFGQNIAIQTSFESIESVGSLQFNEFELVSLETQLPVNTKEDKSTNTEISLSPSLEIKRSNISKNKSVMTKYSVQLDSQNIESQANVGKTDNIVNQIEQLGVKEANEITPIVTSVDTNIIQTSSFDAEKNKTELNKNSLKPVFKDTSTQTSVESILKETESEESSSLNLEASSHVTVKNNEQESLTSLPKLTKQQKISEFMKVSDNLQNTENIDSNNFKKNTNPSVNLETSTLSIVKYNEHNLQNVENIESENFKQNTKPSVASKNEELIFFDPQRFKDARIKNSKVLTFENAKVQNSNEETSMNALNGEEKRSDSNLKASIETISIQTNEKYKQKKINLKGNFERSMVLPKPKSKQLHFNLTPKESVETVSPRENVSTEEIKTENVGFFQPIKTKSSVLSTDTGFRSELINVINMENSEDNTERKYENVTEKKREIPSKTEINKIEFIDNSQRLTDAEKFNILLNSYEDLHDIIKPKSTAQIDANFPEELKENQESAISDSICYECCALPNKKMTQKIACACKIDKSLRKPASQCTCSKRDFTFTHVICSQPLLESDKCKCNRPEIDTSIKIITSEPENLETQLEKSIDLEEDDLINPKEVGECFRRGFRADNLTLAGNTYLKMKGLEKLEAIRSAVEMSLVKMINFSEKKTPLDFLIGLGFSVDAASTALKNEEVKNRLTAAITEARIWANSVSSTQGTLLYLLACKSKPSTMRYFLQIVEAIINNRISDAVKLDGFLKLLEKLESGYLPMLLIFGSRKFETNQEDKQITQKHLQKLFVNMFMVAQKEADFVGRTFTKHDSFLLEHLTTYYRPGLYTHLELIAKYIGRGQLVSLVQLEAAVIYLSRIHAKQIDLNEFEHYCGIDKAQTTPSE